MNKTIPPYTSRARDVVYNKGHRETNREGDWSPRQKQCCAHRRDAIR